MRAELGEIREISRFFGGTCEVGGWAWMLGLLEACPSQSTRPVRGLSCKSDHGHFGGISGMELPTICYTIVQEFGKGMKRFVLVVQKHKNVNPCAVEV